MYDEQLRRASVNEAMSATGDYSERIQNMLTSVGIDVYLSNLVGHSVSLHVARKAKGACTCYTRILGYGINPDKLSLTLHITGDLFETPIKMLTYNFASNNWTCHGSASIMLTNKDVCFTNRVAKTHRELFKDLSLIDQSILGHQIALVDPKKGDEVVTSIASISVTTTIKKITSVKITPVHCYKNLSQIKYLEIWEGHLLWNILPGREISRVIML
jgi:hypothetical protein